MCVCACVHACMHVCVCVCVHVCACVCVLFEYLSVPVCGHSTGFCYCFFELVILYSTMSL